VIRAEILTDGCGSGLPGPCGRRHARTVRGAPGSRQIRRIIRNLVLGST